ncbi:HAD family hydrolase [Candidatus Poribacteria bacterium]
MKHRFIDVFDVLLLDMGLTFMFNSDRFSDSEDYGATYRRVGGDLLNGEEVRRIISTLFDRMMSDYENPALYDYYPSVLSHLQTIPETRQLPEKEIKLLERVFEMHEVGDIPATHAEALYQLRETHRLGVVSNIWSTSEIHLQEFERAGIRHLFDVIIFSSDHGCIKPSRYLFDRAMEAFEVDRSRMVFVGDSLDRDIAGAKSVGLSAIWIDAEASEVRKRTPRPDLVIQDLWDLLEI